MPSPVKDGNTWTWNWNNAAISVVIMNNTVKFDFILKNNNAPSSITIPFSTQGLSRQGNLLYHDEEVIAQLRKPFAIDANGIERDCAVNFNAGSITVSLDTTGLIYPIDIDPTIDVQVSADDNDCFTSNGVQDNGQTLVYLNWNNGTHRIGGFRFDTVNITQGDTIDTAYLSLYFTSTAGDDPQFNIHAEDTDDSGVLEGGVNISTRDKTTASVAWTATGIGSGWENSAELKTVIQEVIDRPGWVWGNALTILTESTNDADYRCYVNDYQGNSTNAAKLHIEYTPGGVSLPTVTSDNATNITITTATLAGNVTASSENVTVRGFSYGTSSGNYTNSVNETGNWATGIFSLPISSLPSGTNIYWHAWATNPGGTGNGTEKVFTTLPAAPTNVSATDGASTENVTITWDSVVGSDNYTIWRDSVNITSVGAITTYVDTGADAPTITAGATVASDGTSTLHVSLSLAGESANSGTVHSYKVQAHGKGGNSANSTPDNGNRGIGALGYQYYRSAGDSDASYSVIVGATSSTYNDTSAPDPTLTGGNATASDGTFSSHVALSANETANNGAGRYWKCELSAAGATNQTATANRGYTGTTTLTYQWWRSNSDNISDNYTLLAGATTDPYNDTTGAIAPNGRYYLVEVSMLGATSVNSSADRGYRSAIPTVLQPPTNFILTDLGAQTVNMEWTKAPTATQTIIRYRRGSFPTTILEGEPAYNGTAETGNISGLSLEWTTWYFSAWSHDNVTGGYSVNYATASIGGDSMIYILLGMMAMIPLITGMILNREKIYMISSPFFMILGFYCFIQLNGANPIANWNGWLGIFSIMGGMYIIWEVVWREFSERKSRNIINQEVMDNIDNEDSETKKPRRRSRVLRQPRKLKSLW